MRQGRRGLIFIYILLGCSFLFGKIHGGFIAWFLFYICLFLSLYVSVVAWGLLRDFTAVRELSSSRLTAGETLRVTITFKQGFNWLGSWIFLCDHSSLMKRAERGEAEVLLFSNFKRQGTHQYVIRNLPRGRHRFFKIEVEAGDLFGLVERRMVVEAKEELLVYPAIRRIQSWYTVNERSRGQAYRMGKMNEDFTSVVGIREYIRGDRLNRIDWKATARGMSLKVKEFEHQVSNDLVLVLDQRESSFPKGAESQFERGVQLAASLAHYAIHQHHPVGLISCGVQRITFDKGRTQDHLIRLLEFLAEVEIGGEESLSETLLQESHNLSPGTTLAVITSALDQPLVQAVHELVLRRKKVELFILQSLSNWNTNQLPLWEQLERTGVKLWPVTHDGFEEILKGEIHHVANAAKRSFH